ncbi:MAG: haloalkane dehalogenase [Cyclobacteriaceae bacterium]
MEILQTPEECFENLADYDFKASYVTLGDLRMHYIDHGYGEEVVLLLHGEPSWSFLYRKMIKKIAQSGYRVIAPDLIGFGKSDKPTDPDIFTYQNHYNWVKDFVVALDLKEINLFCQDWGGLLGLRLVALEPQLFARVIASNTFLPIGQPAPSDEFLKWREFSKTSEQFDIGKVIQMGSASELAPETIAAYNAPFPDESYKVGARVFPSIVPIDFDDPEAEINRECWKELQTFDKPFLTAFGDTDPITKGGEKVMQKLIPGCKGMFHPTVSSGGHFIQEDKPDLLSSLIVNLIKNTK